MKRRGWTIGATTDGTRFTNNPHGPWHDRQHEKVDILSACAMTAYFELPSLPLGLESMFHPVADHRYVGATSHATL